MADSPATEQSLYKRLGGYDVIAAVVDEFSQTFVSDPRAARFLGMNVERQKRNRQLTVDYLCAAAGGPVLYLGQDMKTAHAGLRITPDEWKIAMEHVQGAVTKLKIPEREAQELMGLFFRSKDEVIDRA